MHESPVNMLQSRLYRRSPGVPSSRSEGGVTMIDSVQTSERAKSKSLTDPANVAVAPRGDRERFLSISRFASTAPSQP